MTLSDWDKFFKKQNELLIKVLETPTLNTYKRLLKNERLPEKPAIIELGCGTGLISLYLAQKYNAKITLVDYSSNALKMARRFFKKAGVKAEFIKANFFKLKLNKKYDLVHSQGVIEHFKKEKQEELIKIHKRFLKRNARLIILAPRPSIYYKTWRWIIEKVRGEWPFGYEKPINKEEGVRLLSSQGIKLLKTEKTMLENAYLGK